MENSLSLNLDARSKRSPDIVDGAIFRVADAVSATLGEYAEKELSKGKVDWMGVGASFLGIAISESIKAEVNSNISPPFISWWQS